MEKYDRYLTKLNELAERYFLVIIYMAVILGFSLAMSFTNDFMAFKVAWSLVTSFLKTYIFILPATIFFIIGIRCLARNRREE